MIVVGVFWFAVSFVDIEYLKQLPGLAAVPAYLEYLLVVDWLSPKPWEFFHLVVFVTGLGMLFIAGKAVSSSKHDIDYSEERPSMVKIMTGLRRTRTLAVIAALAIALGSVVVNLKSEWVEEYVLGWAVGIQGFYSVE